MTVMMKVIVYVIVTVNGNSNVAIIVKKVTFVLMRMVILISITIFTNNGSG